MENLNEDSDSDDMICISSDYKIMISKLDAVMTELMQYMKKIHSAALASRDEQLLYDFYYATLDAFDRIMLPTHKLKCAQFILFYMCSLVPDTFSEDYLSLLITHLINEADSNVIRMSSAAYLGSLIARAKYIHISSVRHCLKIMNQLCVEYVSANESDIVGQLKVWYNLLQYSRYGVLYSTVQAILYIFCFRWKQLMIIDDKPHSGSFPVELSGFQRVLLSKFSPLRV